MSDGDDDDFREFMAAQIDDLRRLAFLACGDWHSAEDAVSIGLTKLYLSWRKVTNPYWYARRIVMNAAIDQARKPWRRERVAEAEHLDRSVADTVDELTERDRMQRALLKVPAKQRTVLLLRFYEDLSVEDVAEILNRSTGTIKSQTARGLTALRAALDETEHEGSTDGERFTSAIRRRPA